VDIDREQHSLTASGNVVTQLVEDSDEPGSASELTIVRAANMVYTEGNRLARYTGGVALNRPGLDLKALELQAYLAEQGADSRLDKAFADGKVRIVRTAPQRTLTGTSEHAEYYTDEEKIILREGEPQLIDSKWGTTRGSELTYFANDDRLLVNGAPNRPATSRVRRK
jgi:lipopolysaccharide export system protein LptA